MTIGSTAFDLACIGSDVAFDGLGTASLFPLHPSTHGVIDAARSLQQARYGVSALPKTDVVDQIFTSHIASEGLFTEQQANTLRKGFADLQHGRLALAELAQVKANVSSMMRSKINPLMREVKELRVHVNRKIQKRESLLKRNGALSESERKELRNLRSARHVFNDLHQELGAHQKTFKALDAKHEIFTGGQRFRRNGLNGAHAAFRFYSQHRVVILSAVATLFVTAAVGALIRSLTPDTKSH